MQYVHGSMKELDDLIEDIREQEEQKVGAAQSVRERCADTVFDDDGAVESTLVHDVTPASLESLSVAGVDGGLTKEELHGIDLIFVRAVAPRFSYQDGSLEDCEYHPSKNPSPRMEYTTQVVERNEFRRLSSLHRLKEEIQRAVEVAENDTIDLLLLDGSILPQYPDKPSKDSAFVDLYDEVMDLYVELYETTVENDIHLAGVVEDTRSASLCGMLQDNGLSHPVLDSCRDSHFLNYLLDPGERTLLMHYSHNEHHPILSDLSGHGDHIYSFYLKSVDQDRPVRIDLYAPGTPSDTVETVASTIYAMSDAHHTYGLPSVLIEADKRAKLDGPATDSRVQRLQSRLNHLSGVEELRRNRRPF